MAAPFLWIQSIRKHHWFGVNKQKLNPVRTDAKSGSSDRASNSALIAVMSMPLYAYDPRVSENVIGLV